MNMKKLLHILALPFLSLTTLQTYALTEQQNTKPETNATVGSAISDTAITGKIKAKIAGDPNLSVFNVNVSTEKGTVTLAGTVNSDTDAGALVEIVQSTEGVTDIDTSKLNVKNSKQPFADTVITAKVKGIYIREKLLGKNVPATISVETNNGVVYLSGQVDNEEQKTNAIKLAKGISGVKNVESRLTVEKK